MLPEFTSRQQRALVGLGLVLGIAFSFQIVERALWLNSAYDFSASDARFNQAYEVLKMRDLAADSSKASIQPKCGVVDEKSRGGSRRCNDSRRQ